MKVLFDFFPILLFFIAYKVAGIYAATVVAIVASFVQSGLYWLKHRRFEKMYLLTLALIVIFGGATLLLQDPVYIKWKPTVVNWLFAAAFLVSPLVGDKCLLERMMGHAISVPPGVWSRLNAAWAVFFVIMGGANLYVAFRFDENTWVNFKLFGLMGMTMIFAVGQAFYLARHIEPDQETGGTT